MFFLSEPKPDRIAKILERHQSGPFSYPNVGMINEAADKEWADDTYRCTLGEGQAVFDRAVRAIENWQQFDLGWVKQVRPVEDVPIEIGSVAAVAAKTFGLWTVNLNKIHSLYESEDEQLKTWGYAFGTLEHHVEVGEEKFLIELDKASQEVTFNIRAYSRPSHPLVWLGYPLARRVQRCFGRDSQVRMQQAVK